VTFAAEEFVDFAVFAEYTAKIYGKNSELDVE